MTERPGQQPDPLRQLKPGEPRYHSLWRPRPPGSYYDAATAEAAVSFFPSYCRLTTDEWRGQPFVLEPWQAEWIIRPAFGWKRADGTRLYRRVIIWIPKKNGKSELIAGVSHLCLAGDAVGGAEAYALATNGNQADNLFATSKTMVDFSPELAELYEVFEKSLYLRATGGRFEPLTGKVRGKDGFKTTYLFGDEVHEWESDGLYSIVREGMASRREPMEWLISTAGVDGGFGVKLWEESVGICEATYDDPSTLVVVWCAPQDPKVEVDILDERVWREANPNLGVSKRHEFMIEKAREARQATSAENTFKCKHLNIWVGQAERWLPMDKWNLCTTGGPDSWLGIEERMLGRPCYTGLDLASNKDFCAAVHVFPPMTDDERYVFLPRFWWPRETMRHAVPKTRIPFESWEKMGAFKVTEGNVADMDLIVQDMIDDANKFQMQGLGIDDWNHHAVSQPLKEAGIPTQLIRFAMVSIMAPSKLLERLVYKEQIDHGNQPVLRWMAANCAIRRDGKNPDNYMPARPERGALQKIDGIAAAVMALAMASQEPAPRSDLAETGNIMFVPYGPRAN
jgi:phage terminase large subunit-like protein